MVEATGYRYLKFARFKELAFWDYYTLSNKDTISAHFPLVKLGEVLKQRKGSITIDDATIYKRCKVQLYGKGVVLRDEVPGAVVKTKKQQLCKPEDFLVAEIDAKFGGYGIVPADLNDAIVSSHYFLFEIDQTKLRPAFLGLVVKLPQFSKQVKATGSTNYAAIRPFHVLGYQIPLPSLAEQDALVAAYAARMEEAEAKEAQAAGVDEEIERYFLEQLGLPPFTQRVAAKGFQLVRFADLERWDAYSADNRINALLKHSPFELKKLGAAYDFVSRGWNKRATKEVDFRYVEIGSVDSASGITEAKVLPVAKAPSRASQKIKEGDLILGTTRPYLKKFALVDAAYDDAVASSGFAVIEQSERYNLPFLRQFLVSAYGVEQLRNKMSGALYPAITDAALKEIKIPFPDVALQSQIMERVEMHRQEIIHSREAVEQLRVIAAQEFEGAIFHS